MPDLKYGQHKIDYKVRRSSRAKNARIDVKMDMIRVVVPKRSNIDPEELLQDNIKWVLEKKERFEEYREKIPDRTIEVGEEISILGQPREIRLKNCPSHQVTEDAIIVSERYLRDKSIKEKVKEILREKAREVINKKVEIYARRIREQVNKVYIRDQKTKWGSCSSKNNLSFNWRLILGPEYVLEYVVVHEMIHLENKKHNNSFWSRVSDIYPEYKKGYNWLKENSHLLVF